MVYLCCGGLFLFTQAGYAEASGCVLQRASEVIGLVNDINKTNIRSDRCFNDLVDRIAEE